MESMLIDKFKSIRDAEELSRVKLSLLIDVPATSIKTMELRGTEPSGKVLRNLCKVFPEYVYWLMIGKTDVFIGQIDPKMKIKWRLWNNLKGRGIIKFDLNNKQHIEQMKSAIELELDKMISIDKDLL